MLSYEKECEPQVLAVLQNWKLLRDLKTNNNVYRANNEVDTNQRN